jgi:hypothetical protein
MDGEIDELRSRGRSQDAGGAAEALVIDTDSDHNTHETARAWPRCS